MVDVVLSPGLAVDRERTRLGQGGGWYDRAVVLRRPGVPVLTLLHDDELLERGVPREPHDEPVDGVVMPSAWFALHAPSRPA